jgi:hypothetical protein
MRKWGIAVLAPVFLVAVAGCAVSSVVHHREVVGPAPAPTPDVSGAHPSGFSPLPEQALHPVPDGSRSALTVAVGDTITVTYWGDGAPAGGPAPLRFAALDGTRATYQAVAPGTETLVTGPVGHPCLEAGGTSCGPDATPPPTVLVTVTPAG